MQALLAAFRKGDRKEMEEVCVYVLWMIVWPWGVGGREPPLLLLLFWSYTKGCRLGLSNGARCPLASILINLFPLLHHHEQIVGNRQENARLHKRLHAKDSGWEELKEDVVFKASKQSVY